MIKAVFIDIDNTLLDFDLGAKDCMKILLEERGKKFEEFMFPIFTEINNSLWRKMEAGDMSKDELFAVRWNTVLNACGIRDIDGAEFEKGFRKLLFDSAVKIDGAKEIADHLHKKYKLYAATNGWHLQQINRLTRAGLIENFDGVFASEEIGFSKPSREYFDVCFKRIGDILPEEAFMIGDSPTADIKGAAEFGMKTILFPFGNKPLPEGTAPDYTVKTLLEIKDIL